MVSRPGSTLISNSLPKSKTASRSHLPARRTFGDAGCALPAVVHGAEADALVSVAGSGGGLRRRGLPAGAAVVGRALLGHGGPGRRGAVGGAAVRALVGVEDASALGREG
jgi:hypothetical protein